MITKSKFIEGNFLNEYFYKDSTNKKIPIKIFSSNDIISDSNQILIFRDGTSGVYGDSESKNSLIYKEFYITTPKNIDKYFSLDSSS